MALMSMRVALRCSGQFATISNDGGEMLIGAGTYTVVAAYPSGVYPGIAPGQIVRSLTLFSSSFIFQCVNLIFLFSCCVQHKCV